MWRVLRIVVLLLLLLTLAVSTWRTKARTTAWKETLQAVVYPMNADNSAASSAYIAQLKEEDFDDMQDFFATETARYGLKNIRPLDVHLAPELTSLPPPRPETNSALAAMQWSLQLRWWAWQHDKWQGGRPDIRLFVLYHDPAMHTRLDHSTGLDKGQMAVIKAFASKQYGRTNQVIISHELLHTLGATDKYNPQTLEPRYPQGYADPQANPRYPQHWAEIMGGRIPMSETSSAIPVNLQRTLIGAQTAQEIGLTAAVAKNARPN